METNLLENSAKTPQSTENLIDSTPVSQNDISLAINDSYCVNENGKKLWKCDVCPKMYTRKHNLITHMLSHAGIKPFSCTECGKCFRQLSHLQTHMLQHKSDKRSHKCEFCTKSFSQQVHLKRHLLLHVDEKPYSCELCCRGFAFPGDLRKHLDKHREADECAECGKEVHPDNMEYHMLRKHNQANKQNSITCEACQTVISYPSTYEEHLETEHKEQLKFQCEMCPKKFLAEAHLKAHVQTHCDSKVFSCSVCSRTFSQKGNMERHMLIHSEKRQFECKTCGKAFKQLQILKMHELSHATTKPFTCKICGRKLARNVNLKAHLALHLNKKPYKCDICDTSFTMKGNLYRHQKDKHGKIVRIKNGKDTEAQEQSEDVDDPGECDKEMEAIVEGDIPLSLLDLHTIDCNDGSDLLDNIDSSSIGKMTKRRKGSPKRICKEPDAAGTITDPIDSFVTNAALNDSPNSPDKAGPSSSEPLPEEPSTSNIPVELQSVSNMPLFGNSIFSPSSNDFLLNGSDMFSSTSSVFPHLPMSYPTQTAVSNMRPLAPIDMGSNPSTLLSLNDGIISRNNESVNAILQFVHGEIDELVDKSVDYPNEKVKALHVAVNELAGLHMSLSPTFTESPSAYLT